MMLSKVFKNGFLIIAACLVLTACATKKEDTTAPETETSGQIQGDTYMGDDTVK